MEVEIDVRRVVSPVFVPEAADQSPSTVASLVSTETTLFESFFDKLGEFIITAENPAAKEGPGSNGSKDDNMVDLISGAPSLEEVEEAKQSFKVWYAFPTSSS